MDTAGMSDYLKLELEFLSKLSTADLIRELDACRERLAARPSPPAPSLTTSETVVTPIAEPETAPAVSPEATVAVEPAASSVAVGGLKQRSKLIMEFTPETIGGIEPHVDTVYSTVSALRALFDLYPGVAGLTELVVAVENGEPCSAGELIILAATGDLAPEQPIQISTADLRQALGDSMPRAVPASV